MSDEVFNKLKDFAVKESGYDEKVTRDTQMEKDLGITGDDAVDFMIAYGKTFNVDVTNFMAADYFEGEGDVILPAIIRVISGKKKQRNKVLTIGHLEKGILAGRLDEKVINSN